MIVIRLFAKRKITKTAINTKQGIATGKLRMDLAVSKLSSYPTSEQKNCF